MTTPGTTPGEPCPCCLQAREDIKAAVAEARELLVEIVERLAELLGDALCDLRRVCPIEPHRRKYIAALARLESLQDEAAALAKETP